MGLERGGLEIVSPERPDSIFKTPLAITLMVVNCPELPGRTEQICWSSCSSAEGLWQSAWLKIVVFLPSGNNLGSGMVVWLKPVFVQTLAANW